MKLQYVTNQLTASIQLPSSKSISNRVLMINALCAQHFEIEHLSEANDTQLLMRLLHQIEHVTACQTIDCEDAGTPYRFLLSYLCLQEGKEFILTGNERLKERPIVHLVNALKLIGADIYYIEKEGFAPLRIRGKKLKGGIVEIDSHLSSQFVSSLCLIAPCLSEGLTITLKDTAVSVSYIHMTLEMMKEFAVHVQLMNDQIIILSQPYLPKSFSVENDWSSATFFYAMAMISPQIHLELDGLFETSLQGDSAIRLIAEDFGITSQFSDKKLIITRSSEINEAISKEYNLNSYPDLAIPFIVACALRYPQVRISGIEHLELKESKRITALTTELLKIGIKLHYQNDLLRFEKMKVPQQTGPVFFETYNDHRIAMALSMLTLAGFSFELDQTQCVRKSFPAFFHEIAKLGIK